MNFTSTHIAYLEHDSILVRFLVEDLDYIVLAEM